MDIKINLEQVTKQAVEYVKEAGIYVRSKHQFIRNLKIDDKGIRDFVTEADTNSEKMLVALLGKLLPQAGFITEEKTVAQTIKDYNWIIDPLDGTLNYIHGLPFYSISVALQYKSKLIAGIVYEVHNQEMFTTWLDGASYLNGEKIHVSACRNMQDAMVATGFPYIRNENTKAITQTLKYFLDNCRDIRRLGTAAMDLCYVACGRFDIYYEGFLNAWDISAGILIVRNAGGMVTNFKGEDNFEEGNLVATNQFLHTQTLEAIQF